MPPPIVFTGLSISGERVLRLVPAEIRPPIKRGHLDRLVDGSVVAISTERSLKRPQFQSMKSVELCAEA
jgi:hypothetical protein